MAAFGYQGWQRFSDDFKGGYVTGFLAMAGLARNLQPGGWVDEKYPEVPNAKPLEWVAVISELYKDPKNQGYSMPSIMMTAARRLEEKHGKALPPYERAKQRMQRQLETARKNRAAAGVPPPEPQAAAAPPNEMQGASNSKASASKAAVNKPPRKWCRCDGKDPKAARAQRKEAAEAKEAAEPAGAAQRPPGADKPAERPVPK